MESGFAVVYGKWVPVVYGKFPYTVAVVYGKWVLQ